MHPTRTAAALATTAWSAATARRGVPSWDAALFRALNGLPDSIAPWLWAPMQAGALGAPLSVAAVLLTRRRPASALRIAATGSGAWGLAKVFKSRIARERPGAHVRETTLRIGSADHGLGYPSGHAAVAATLMLGLTTRRAPAWQFAGGLLAAVVGVSRVYVGAHYPLDVIGGWAIGVAIADSYDALERRTLAPRYRSSDG